MTRCWYATSGPALLVNHKRGTPCIRPPFPVESGYLGQPTVVNNVETFVAAAPIVLRGESWWAELHPAAAWLLAIEGEQFELGAELSEVAQARLAQAVTLAVRWCEAGSR